MGTVGISLGSIILAAIVFYFVIKWAVTAAITAGINNSMLFNGTQREEQPKRDSEKTADIEEPNKE